MFVSRAWTGLAHCLLLLNMLLWSSCPLYSCSSGDTLSCCHALKHVSMILVSTLQLFKWWHPAVLLRSETCFYDHRNHLTVVQILTPCPVATLSNMYLCSLGPSYNCSGADTFPCFGHKHASSNLVSTLQLFECSHPSLFLRSQTWFYDTCVHVTLVQVLTPFLVLMAMNMLTDDRMQPRGATPWRRGNTRHS